MSFDKWLSVIYRIESDTKYVYLMTKRRSSNSAIRITFAYFILGSAWIFFSDMVASTIFADISLRHDIELLKGFFFVLLSCLLIYIVVHRLELELNESIDKLKNANDDLQVFFYKTHHDVRGPLKTIMGLAGLAESNFPEPVSRECTLKITDVAQRMDRLVSRLAKLGSLIDGKLHSSAIDTGKMLREVLDQLKLFNIGNKVKVKVELNAPGTFIADESLVQTALICVIENAIQFYDLNKDTAIVNISISSLKNHITFDIDDTGIGMDEATLMQAFDLFYRGSKQSTGAGLGLYLVKQAVQKLGGEVTIQSTLGKGTKVQIKIPRRPNISSR